LKAERAKAQAQEAAATKASHGKDPYALFKEALDSEPGAPPEVDRKEWREWRATYSRAKMVEHHRVNAHFTKMIQLREEAIKLLPPQLQEEARRVDTAPLPIERRIFTETAPIPGFQDKLASTAQEEL